MGQVVLVRVSLEGLLGLVSVEGPVGILCIRPSGFGGSGGSSGLGESAWLGGSD